MATQEEGSCAYYDQTFGERIGWNGTAAPAGTPEGGAGQPASAAFDWGCVARVGRSAHAPHGPACPRA